MKTPGAMIAMVLAMALATSACSADGETPAAAAATSSVAPADPSASAEAAEPDDARAESSKPDRSGKQTAVFDRIEGNETGECVDAGSERNVKSGGFMAGPFDDAAKSWGRAGDGLKKNQVRLFWVPLHAKRMPGVTVVAKHQGSGSRVKVTTKDLGEAEEWKYYSVVIALPKPGVWTLRGASGKDAGCFTLTVGGSRA